MLQAVQSPSSAEVMEERLSADQRVKGMQFIRKYTGVIREDWQVAGETLDYLHSSSLNLKPL